MNALTKNQLNFSAGPGALPEKVLEELKQTITVLPETGVSILGMSHRTSWFENVIAETCALIRRLMQVPSDYEIILMQGGSSLQFTMIPINFDHTCMGPQYIVGGYWSKRALEAANKNSHAARLWDTDWDGLRDGYRVLPKLADLKPNPDTPYVHYVTNETVEGLQFHDYLDTPAPVVADMSSDFMSRPVDVSRFGMIYAHAQKNLGPAGVTVAIIHRDLLKRSHERIPDILNYDVLARHASNYNTPPVFAIYAMLLVLRWLDKDMGSLKEMGALNTLKANALYDCLERYAGIIGLPAHPDCRSQMNVAFHFACEEHNRLFLQQSKEAGFSGLEGHRSYGGLRASLYNGVTPEAVEALAHFIDGFVKYYG
jgi:phosphoserine aminotransferase